MERWAANTLRTLGITLTASFVFVVSAILLLLSMCSFQPNMGGGTSPRDGYLFLGAAVLVILGGVAFITWLARGIYRSSKLAPDSTDDLAAAQSAVPFHLSPLGRQAIDRVVIALVAQIVVSAAVWLFNQIRFWSGPRIFAPFPAPRWIMLFVFVLYHVPYAILIYVLLKRPDRRAFAYSLAVPAVLIMQALFSLSYARLFLQGNAVGFLLLLIPWFIHIVILVLAYQAIQQVGLHPPPSSLIIAAAVALVFFLAMNGVTPFLYRFTAR